jgi:hypothetical protein
MAVFARKTGLAPDFLGSTGPSPYGAAAGGLPTATHPGGMGGGMGGQGGLGGAAGSGGNLSALKSSVNSFTRELASSMSLGVRNAGGGGGSGDGGGGGMGRGGGPGGGAAGGDGKVRGGAGGCSVCMFRLEHLLQQHHQQLCRLYRLLTPTQSHHPAQNSPPCSALAPAWDSVWARPPAARGRGWPGSCPASSPGRQRRGSSVCSCLTDGMEGRGAYIDSCRSDS